MLGFKNMVFIGAVVIGVSILGSCSGSKQSQSSSGKSDNRKAETDVLTRYSHKLGVPTSALVNKKLYVFIDQWEGVPYKYGGTSKVGVDCSGFIGLLYREVYNSEVARTTTELAARSKPVSKNALKEGDLVFFDINGKKSSHVGVYLHNGKFIHASTSKGVIISELDNPYYQQAFAKGGRL